VLKKTVGGQRTKPCPGALRRYLGKITAARENRGRTQKEAIDMAGANVRVFNDDNFEQEVLKSDVPVIVDFTATWCGPCKALSPIIEQLATELDGKVRVGKLDIDDAPTIAGKYGIRGVPTIMVFKQGKTAAQHVGLTTKQKLVDLVGQ
jgi:thioredoxin 1